MVLALRNADILNAPPDDVDARLAELQRLLDGVDRAIQLGDRGAARASVLTARRLVRSMRDPGHGVQAEIGSLRSRISDLQVQVQRDPLTGVANRRTFDEALFAAVERARQLERPLSLLYLDVDWFKRINDTHGHILGDEVLRCLGRALAAGVREGDVVARIGGEEFAVILVDTPWAAALDVARRLRSHPVCVDTPNGRIEATLSAGLTGLRTGDGPRTLCERADAALYTSKRDGRDRLTVDR